MNGKVAVFTEPMEPMEFREYPLPEVGNNDILVKVSCSNICGSDLHIWHGHGPKLPEGVHFVPGHEMMGQIFEMGSGIQTDCLGQPLEEGDRIAYSYFLPCGSCPACLSGSPACPNRARRWFRDANESPHFGGAYGDYYYLPQGQTVCKIPAELADTVVSPVNCALSQSIYGLHEIGVQLGDTVLIQGAGGLGLYAVAIAKDMGAGSVIVFDRFADRLELAREFGADITVNIDEVAESDRRELVFDNTQGRGADIVAEFVGFPGAVTEGVQLLRQDGRYLWVGNITPGRPSKLDPGTVVRGAHAIRGIIAYEPWVLPRAVDFLKRRRHFYPFHKIVSHSFPFSDINQAFSFADEGKAIRVSLQM